MTPIAAYEEDGVVCVQAVFAGDTEEDEEEMAAALDDWAGAMVGGEAEVTDVDGHPGIKACDPGESADLELTGRSATSLFLPNLWGYLVADAAAVLDAEQSRCYARTVIDELTYEQITDPEGGVRWRGVPADPHRRARGLRRVGHASEGSSDQSRSGVT